jgi:asparagine synthase (glutamine-hydrolysing)
MLTDDGMYAISYNGEVYNFQELRTELQSLGHRFFSRTDTEVVLKAYVAWGEKAFERFNGMFAFAIWDRTRQQLILARDRYGIKPLYYTLLGKSFLFGSEIKAFLQHPSYHRDLDKEALIEYFTFQNFFTDRTLFKDIRLFPAGSWMRIPLACSVLQPPVKYWDFNFSEPATLRDENEYIEELDRLFQQSVNRQLISDVEIGAYLSGGMDSGSITAIAAQKFPYLKSFTCGFDLHSASGLELAFDERDAAEHMSYLFRTEHYEMVLKAGDMERCFPKLAWHMEEPRVGQSYPNFYMAQIASKFVKVVLAGTGGDETFGGYPWRYYRAIRNNDFEHYIDKYFLFWQRLIPGHDFQFVFRPIWKDVQHVVCRDIFRNVYPDHAHGVSKPEDYVNHSLYFESKTFLHGLLIMEDKLSMAHGLESRVPFLDNDLVNFAMQVPVRLKLGKFDEVIQGDTTFLAKKSSFPEKMFDGKLILRKAMEKHIPNTIAQRQKQGFSAPDATWFKGESIDYVKRILCSKEADIYDYLDFQSVTGLINEHLNGLQNRRLLIWSLLSFAQWLKTYLK